MAGKKSDYRKELEVVARQMILVRDVDVLIKSVLETIVQKLSLTHAVLILYDREKKEYVAKVSKGGEGARIPVGFTKVTEKNSLVRYFTKDKQKVLGKDYLLFRKLNAFLASGQVKKNKKLKKKVEDINFQFSLYDAKVCIPGFFREKLIYLLFLGKKKKTGRFTQRELGFLSVLSSDIVMAIQNAWYFQDLEKQLKANNKLFLQTTLSLASAIEAKDKYTSGHTERVSKFSVLIAKEIRKKHPKLIKKWKSFLENLRIASLLHDVGKIGVPESVLNKEGPLDEKERVEMQKHSLIGYSILNRIDEFRQPLMGVKYHHERYDGCGYPERVKGDNIPLIAQIISVADTFDALTTDRPYRKGFSIDKSVKIIKENRGTQFSPAVVDAFLKIMKGEIRNGKKEQKSSCRR